MVAAAGALLAVARGIVDDDAGVVSSDGQVLAVRTEFDLGDLFLAVFDGLNLLEIQVEDLYPPVCHTDSYQAALVGYVQGFGLELEFVDLKHLFFGDVPHGEHEVLTAGDVVVGFWHHC